MPAELRGRGDGLGSAAASPTGAVIPLGLLLRWALATRDGDIQGGDLPGWMAELFGPASIIGLADRRGECIHAGVPPLAALLRRAHDPPRPRRRSGGRQPCAGHGAGGRGAGSTTRRCPSRYVFDEGHHLFDAADGAFSAELSGIETAELRRWLLGAEGGRSRARGLRRRIEELIAGEPELEAPLDAALQAARALPAPGWSARLAETANAPELGGLDAGRPNPTEAFLRLARRQVLARLPGDGRAVRPRRARMRPASGRARAARGRRAAGAGAGAHRGAAGHAARAAARPARRRGGGARRSDAQPHRGDRPLARAPGARSAERVAGDAAGGRRDPAGRAGRAAGAHCSSCGSTGAKRATGMSGSTAALARPHRAVRRDPRSAGAGVAGHVGHPARLRGRRRRRAAWEAAEARVGAPHLPSPAIRVAVASPFDYAAQTRAFVVTDVMPGDIAALAAAYRALFLASGGGALGLFTAIRRLQAVHAQDRAGAGGGRHPAARAARRPDGQRHAGRHLPHRGGELSARHRRDARRRGRAGPRAAARGVREGAVAAARHPAPRAPGASLRLATPRATTTASRGSGCARHSAG